MSCTDGGLGLDEWTAPRNLPRLNGRGAMVTSGTKARRSTSEPARRGDFIMAATRACCCSGARRLVEESDARIAFRWHIRRWKMVTSPIGVSDSNLEINKFSEGAWIWTFRQISLVSWSLRFELFSLVQGVLDFDFQTVYPLIEELRTIYYLY